MPPDQHPAQRYDERFYRVGTNYLASTAGVFRARHGQPSQRIQRKQQRSGTYQAN